MIRPIERKVIVPQLPADTKAGLSALHEAVLKLAEAHNYHDDQLVAGLRGGVSAANNSRVAYVTVAVSMPVEAPWQTFAPLNSWANQAGYVPAAYLFLPGGVVSTRGVVKGGASGSVMYTRQSLAASLAATSSWSAGLDGAAELRVDKFGILSAVFTGTPKVSLAGMWIAAAPEAPTTFPAPWPVYVQHGFDQCRNVDVVGAFEDTTDARSIAPLPTPAWQDVGNGRLRLDGLWGLRWGMKYNVRLRLSAEA